MYLSFNNMLHVDLIENTGFTERFMFKFVWLHTDLIIKK